MIKFQDKYRIESTGLKYWDYSIPWWYYITVNTKDHKEYFGEIVDSKMQLSEMGIICEKCWNEIPLNYSNVELDYYVIMPNHVHGIIIINSIVKTGHAPSLQTLPNSLSNILGSFKSAVTKKVHCLGESVFGWQERFYDRIIRNERELFEIRKYIDLNPLKWEIEKHDHDNLTL
ncbi:MAG: transposase [Bacteroidetes bacterium]|nr:transposase [Bacteroidota bacterium]